MQYPVVETFVSINGEGTKAGELAVFVRFRGCNLHCSYCDTRWACEADAKVTWMNAEEIYQLIKKEQISNVTLTGGEPLGIEKIEDLLVRLGQDEELNIEIETNGSILLAPFIELPRRPHFTLDYKLPSSNMEKFMNFSNYQWLEKEDTVKFVAGSLADLEKMREVVNTYQLTEKCHVYLSPVFGQIEPSEMVEFMKKHQLNGVRLQLQLHKFIWDPNLKGV